MCYSGHPGPGPRPGRAIRLDIYRSEDALKSFRGSKHEKVPKKDQNTIKKSSGQACSVAEVWYSAHNKKYFRVVV